MVSVFLRASVAQYGTGLLCHQRPRLIAVAHKLLVIHHSTSRSYCTKAHTAFSSECFRHQLSRSTTFGWQFAKTVSFSFVSLLSCSGAFIRRIGIGIITYRKETQKWLALRLHYWIWEACIDRHHHRRNTPLSTTSHNFALFFGLGWDWFLPIFSILTGGMNSGAVSIYSSLVAGFVVWRNWLFLCARASHDE